MATSLARMWKRFGIVMPREHVVTGNYRDERKSQGLREGLKCLFLGHVMAPELRSDKRGFFLWRICLHKKRHYRYCKECSKRWYED